ncbi:MAG: hypothetical protein P8125_14395 [Gemmatimonadota bacterium]
MLRRSTFVFALAVLGLAGCQDTPTDTAIDTASFKKSAAPDFYDEAMSLLPEIAAAARNSGNGAGFIEGVALFGAFLSDTESGDVCVLFQENRQNGSFYRMNPDGTVTMKVTDNNAYMAYAPGSPGDGPAEFVGSGTLQAHATGVPDIFSPFPGLTFVTVLQPYRSAFMISGVGQVAANGTEHRLRCTVKETRSGERTGFVIDLN